MLSQLASMRMIDVGTPPPLVSISQSPNEETTPLSSCTYQPFPASYNDQETTKRGLMGCPKNKQNRTDMLKKSAAMPAKTKAENTVAFDISLLVLAVVAVFVSKR